MEKTYIGIDIGGTKIHGIRMNEKGKVLREKKIPTEAHKGFDHVFTKLVKLIHFLQVKSTQTIGIGIASPIDYKKGNVVFASNMPGWKNIPLKKLIEKETHLPVFIENDAKCFVIAEHEFGAGKGYAHMVGITVGTGIGGGIIIDNKLYRGRDNIAGELGHMAINFKKHPCPCKSTGCYERFASGTAILERTLEHLHRNDFVTGLKEKNLTTRDIYKAAIKKNDPLAVHIVCDTGFYLGVGIANIINVLNPEVIVLGGSVAKYNFPIFEKNMRHAIKHRSFSPGNNVPIVVEKLRYPGTIGAAVVGMKEGKI